MVDLSLDYNVADRGMPQYGDILVINNDVALTSDANPVGTNPVLQNVLQNLKWILGEWFLENTGGVPWFQKILVKAPSPGESDAILANTILATPGVTQLTSYSFKLNPAGRLAQVSFRAQSTSGPINYSGTVSAGGSTT